MNCIKTLLFLSFLAYCTSCNAQSKDSIFTKTNLFKSLYLDLETPTYTVNFNKINVSKTAQKFSIYNENTKLNDLYIPNKDGFIYSTSQALFENNIRGNKIDSFNPYGTSNIGSAVVLGVIGLILK